MHSSSLFLNKTLLVLHLTALKIVPYTTFKDPLRTYFKCVVLKISTVFQSIQIPNTKCNVLIQNKKIKNRLFYVCHVNTRQCFSFKRSNYSLCQILFLHSFTNFVCETLFHASTEHLMQIKTNHKQANAQHPLMRTLELLLSTY